MKISYAVTACNEHVELDRLLSQLSRYIRPEDEIVVQLDTTATDKVISVVEKYHLVRYYFPLNNDFASFKNNLKQHCKGDFIFQIDADEVVSEFMIEMLPQILEANPELECASVPRINTVEGLTQEHINKWGWNVTANGWINFPDFQMRILKNKPEIRWENKVHEKIVGYKTHAYLPYDQEEWCLQHPKTIERQERQNDFYNTL
jgi:glycosyltransferase involved in cell wall biosynthesis